MINIFRLMFNLPTSKQYAEQIKADSQKQQKSFRFAIFSIISSFLMLQCAVILSLLLSITTKSPYLVALLLAIAFIFIGFIVFLKPAISNLILQSSINKNWSFWTALVVLVLAIGGSLTLIILGFF